MTVIGGCGELPNTDSDANAAAWDQMLAQVQRFRKGDPKDHTFKGAGNQDCKRCEQPLAAHITWQPNPVDLNIIAQALEAS